MQEKRRRTLSWQDKHNKLVELEEAQKERKIARAKDRIDKLEKANSAHSRAWADYLNNRLIRLELSAVTLAEKASVDFSHVSLMLKGRVPRPNIVASVGRALGEEERAMIVAGYLPRPLTRREQDSLLRILEGGASQ